MDDDGLMELEGEGEHGFEEAALEWGGLWGVEEIESDFADSGDVWEGGEGEEWGEIFRGIDLGGVEADGGDGEGGVACGEGGGEAVCVGVGADGAEAGDAGGFSGAEDGGEGSLCDEGFQVGVGVEEHGGESRGFGFFRQCGKGVGWEILQKSEKKY